MAAIQVPRLHVGSSCDPRVLRPTFASFGRQSQSTTLRTSSVFIPSRFRRFRVIQPSPRQLSRPDTSVLAIASSTRHSSCPVSPAPKVRSRERARLAGTSESGGPQKQTSINSWTRRDGRTGTRNKVSGGRDPSAQRCRCSFDNRHSPSLTPWADDGDRAESPSNPPPSNPPPSNPPPSPSSKASLTPWVHDDSRHEDQRLGARSLFPAGGIGEAVVTRDTRSLSLTPWTELASEDLAERGREEGGGASGGQRTKRRGWLGRVFWGAWGRGEPKRREATGDDATNNKSSRNSSPSHRNGRARSHDSCSVQYGRVGPLGAEGPTSSTRIYGSPQSVAGSLDPNLWDDLAGGWGSRQAQECWGGVPDVHEAVRGYDPLPRPTMAIDRRRHGETYGGGNPQRLGSAERGFGQSIKLSGDPGPFLGRLRDLDDQPAYQQSEGVPSVPAFRWPDQTSDGWIDVTGLVNLFTGGARSTRRSEKVKRWQEEEEERRRTQAGSPNVFISSSGGTNRSDSGPRGPFAMALLAGLGKLLFSVGLAMALGACAGSSLAPGGPGDGMAFGAISGLLGSMSLGLIVSVLGFPPGGP